MRLRKQNSLLNREERTLVSLGRAAERFVEADRYARAARRQRNDQSLPCQRNHVGDLPCFRLGTMRVWSEEEFELVETQALSARKWCKNCRHSAPLHEAASWGYYQRRSARAAMTAAYRRLVRIRASSDAE